MGWQPCAPPSSASLQTASNRRGTCTTVSTSPRSCGADVWNRKGVTARTLNRRFDPNCRPGSRFGGLLKTRCRADLLFPPEPPVQRQSTDGPPALIQAAAGLLHRVALRLGAAGRVLIAEQHLAQAEHRLYAPRVLLDVSLQLLDRNTDTSQRKTVVGREALQGLRFLFFFINI